MRKGIEWLIRLWNKQAPSAAQAYRNTFEDGGGRKVLADLAHYCHIGQSTHVPGDPYTSAMNEGRRDVFLHIAEIMEIKPDEIVKILKEINSDG